MKKFLLFITAINICGYMNAQCTNPDTTPPVAVSQNIVVYLDGAGNASIVASDIDNGSSDNCGTVNLSASQTSFNCSDIGVNNVTLNVEDNNGNTNSQISNVIVTDTISPVAVPQNITVFLDGAGNTSITVSDIDNGSSDNCGIANLSASQTSFNCSDIGVNNVTLSVTDDNGNTNSQISNVFVTDTISPVAVSQNITAFLDGTGNTSITASDIDNGSSDNCGTVNLSASQTSFSSADLGANNVTLSVTDDNGNSAESISVVTIEESTLGLIENNFNIKPLFYPNPTEGYFTVNLGDTYENITVTITDLKGVKIQSEKYSNIKTLNLNIDVSAGIYFLRLESKNKKHIIQLVKK